MKLALITDWHGLSLVSRFRFGYHLVLAQHALSNYGYWGYYEGRSELGHFIMLDNGAAEEGTVSADDLIQVAENVKASEVVLPDVMRNSDQTLTATMNPKLLKHIPPSKRAVVPQGATADEWLACANCFVENLEFATLCIPKHTEEYEGGRVSLLTVIQQLGWHQTYNIHLLGLYGSPYTEIKAFKAVAPWIRGFDTAAPFALAQQGLTLDKESKHVSHVWGKGFDEGLAAANISTMHEWVIEKENE